MRAFPSSIFDRLADTFGQLFWRRRSRSSADHPGADSLALQFEPVISNPYPIAQGKAIFIAAKSLFCGQNMLTSFAAVHATMWPIYKNSSHNYAVKRSLVFEVYRRPSWKSPFDIISSFRHFPSCRCSKNHNKPSENFWLLPFGVVRSKCAGLNKAPVLAEHGWLYYWPEFKLPQKPLLISFPLAFRKQ